MTEPENLRQKSLVAFSTFFEKALGAIRPPFMKLLIVLVVSVLLALVQLKGDISRDLGLILLVVVVLIFAFLAFALQYREMCYRYEQRTGNELKKQLREVVMELQQDQAKKLENPGHRRHGAGLGDPKL